MIEALAVLVISTIGGVVLLAILGAFVLAAAVVACALLLEPFDPPEVKRP